MHPGVETLIAYGSGRLPPHEAAALEGHLADCEQCRTELEALPEDPLLSLLRATHPFAEADGGRDGPQPPAALIDHPRYRLLDCLGQGGMGQVWRAEHRLMNRVAALKVIRRRLTENLAAVERFRREMRAVATLDHPNVVRAYDAEEVGGTHFLVMEYVEGVTLARMVEAGGPLPVERACQVVRQVAAGLGHAHDRGVTHRDIKPGNVLVDRGGVAKVLDFGLAAFAAGEGDAGLTGTGQGMGTPDYIAPEQVRDARSADARADIYSLGCTLYFLLAGHAPFPAGNAQEKVAAHLERTPRPLAEVCPDLPGGLADVLRRMTEKDPARRFQTPAEVADALAPFTGSAPLPAATIRRRTRFLLGLTAATGLALAGVLARGRSTDRGPNADANTGPVVEERAVTAGSPGTGIVTPVNDERAGVRVVHPRAYFRYDENFKGLFVELDDGGTGKEVTLSFSQQVVARGRLRAVPAGGGPGAVSRAVVELLPGGNRLAFVPRPEADVRAYPHCGTLTGVRPGPLAFGLEYVDADGDRHPAPTPFEMEVPAFQARIVNRQPGTADDSGPRLRVYSFSFMRDCFVAAGKDARYVEVPRHEAVPTVHEMPLRGVPGGRERTKSISVWVKGTTEDGEPFGPALVHAESLKPDNP